MQCRQLGGQGVLQLKGLGKAGLYCDIVPSQATIRPGGAQAVGAGAHWARSRSRAMGRVGLQVRWRWASGRWSVARAGALHGRTRGARSRSGRRAGGDTAMLACDTAEGLAATRPRLLRHGASARCARGLGVAWVLDGCAGWVNWAKLVY